MFYPQGTAKAIASSCKIQGPHPISPPSRRTDTLQTYSTRDCRPLDIDMQTILPVWSQTAPRDFVSYSMCFPFQASALPNAQEAARAHLLRSLHRLAETRPEFAGNLRLSTALNQPGWLVWHKHKAKAVSVGPDDQPGDGIHATFEDISATFEYNYDELRKRGFPPAAFTHGRFALGINPNPADPGAQPKNPAGAGGAPKRKGVPVLIVRTFFIKGGLLLLSHLHHAFGDGECVRVLLDCLGAATRDVTVRHPPGWTLSLPDVVQSKARDASGRGVGVLAKDCPEYHYVANKMVGPTQPVLREGGFDMSKVETDAKVFVFTEATLLKLRERLRPRSRVGETIGQMPSIYVCLSALAWAHVAHARHETESQEDGVSAAGDATLMNPVNWIKRMKSVEQASSASQTNSRTSGVHNTAINGYLPPPGKTFIKVDDYFGNATTKCLTTVPPQKLLDAARNRDLSDLSDLSAAIRLSISAVDGGYVDARTRLYNALTDYRTLGLEDDPRLWHDLQVNTWRPFGGDAIFDIPGVGGPCKPESIRKAMVGGRCDYRNAIILPAAEGSTEHELFVSLPKVALDALCSDQGFMMWVDRVAG
ncbi:hypothetical protein M9X92_005688 [Pyricularia oryzae]|nr:hypothetical protein M9X92_005688 [Pyricularia oryzae]